MSRRALVEPEHALSITRQCELLGLPRSSYSYQPARESEENLRLMRQIDELYLERPFLGSRQMVEALARTYQVQVNRKRVQRLMRVMGLRSVLPQPGSSAPGPEHKVYPYLLREMKLERVDQVWSPDITYIPVQGGWFYMVAIKDWYSRKILSWELSNSMEVQFCLEALERALEGARPEVFNSDQGAQFTSPRFTQRLEQEGVKISMNGKGRCLDNVWIERFWRSLKYEEVYLKEYLDGVEAWRGIHNYVEYFNSQRAHQGLGGATPAEVYHANRLLDSPHKKSPFAV